MVRFAIEVLEVKMGFWFGRLRGWFAGKKTTLGGCLVIAAGVAGAATGKLASVDAVTVVGVGISICGWSAKANRHQAEILGALEAVAAAGSDLRAGNRHAAVYDMKPLGADAIQLVAAEEVAGK
jgi:hypothetical protein